MVKRLTLSVIAAAALAFSVPSLASAATGLTEGGILLPVGARVSATNSGNLVFTSTRLGNITCQSAKIAAELVANNSMSVQLIGNVSNSSLAKCSLSSGAAMVVSETRISELGTSGGGTGTLSMSFKVAIGANTCTYSVTKGAFAYNPSEGTGGAHVITLSEVPLTVSPLPCGTTRLDGQYTIETSETDTSVFLM